jgi:hypothetical protein
MKNSWNYMQGSTHVQFEQPIQTTNLTHQPMIDSISYLLNLSKLTWRLSNTVLCIATGGDAVMETVIIGQIRLCKCNLLPFS